jgi:hypothetical protein
LKKEFLNFKNLMIRPEFRSAQSIWEEMKNYDPKIQNRPDESKGIPSLHTNNESGVLTNGQESLAATNLNTESVDPGLQSVKPDPAQYFADTVTVCGLTFKQNITTKDLELQTNLLVDHIPSSPRMQGSILHKVMAHGPNV